MTAFILHTTPSGLLLTDASGAIIKGIRSIYVDCAHDRPTCVTIEILADHSEFLLVGESKQLAPLALGNLGKQFQCDSSSKRHQTSGDPLPQGVGSNGGKQVMRGVRQRRFGNPNAVTVKAAVDSSAKKVRFDHQTKVISKRVGVSNVVKTLSGLKSQKYLTNDRNVSSKIFHGSVPSVEGSDKSDQASRKRFGRRLSTQRKEYSK